MKQQRTHETQRIEQLEQQMKDRENEHVTKKNKSKINS
jgi:hypothetical protein